MVRPSRAPRARLALFLSIVATAGVGLAVAPARAESARGVVYLDRDADGVRDRGEPGVPDVAVSNGEDVVRTDAQGRWSLTIEDGDVIFVVKPRDHRVLRDANGLPLFHYVHRPEGTPPELGLRYPGLAPTGPLPASIDFALVPAPESDRFDVLLLADTQPQSHVELDYVRDDVLTPLVDVDAAFGMNLGDILYDDLSLLPRYVDVLTEVDVPWYHVPGNHDLDLLAPDDATSLESFRRWFGPPDYSFDHGQAHFVVLDDVDYAGAETADPTGRGNGRYRGAFTPRQLRWLANDLALVPRDRLVVVSVHIPLRTDLDREDPTLNVLERGPFFDLLAGREHVLVLAGHMHHVEHQWFDEADGWRGATPLHQHALAAASGAWWTGPRDERGIPDAVQRDGVPNGVSILRVEGVRAHVEFRGAHRPTDEQMRIGFDRAHHQLGAALLTDHRPGELFAGPLLVDELGAAEVVVNLFNGGPRSQVWMQIDGREAWMPMERRVREDPYTVEWMARHPETMKGWVAPVPTGHLWFAALPADLDAGAHLLRVRAQDEYGREHTGQRIFEIRR